MKILTSKKRKAVIDKKAFQAEIDRIRLYHQCGLKP